MCMGCTPSFPVVGLVQILQVDDQIVVLFDGHELPDVLGASIDMTPDGPVCTIGFKLGSAVDVLSSLGDGVYEC